jgi:hypothetical protein
MQATRQRGQLQRQIEKEAQQRSGGGSSEARARESARRYRVQELTLILGNESTNSSLGDGPSMRSTTKEQDRGERERGSSDEQGRHRRGGLQRSKRSGRSPDHGREGNVEESERFVNYGGRGQNKVYRNSMSIRDKLRGQGVMIFFLFI